MPPALHIYAPARRESLASLALLLPAAGRWWTLLLLCQSTAPVGRWLAEYVRRPGWRRAIYSAGLLDAAPLLRSPPAELVQYRRAASEGAVCLTIYPIESGCSASLQPAISLPLAQ